MIVKASQNLCLTGYGGALLLGWVFFTRHLKCWARYVFGMFLTFVFSVQSLSSPPHFQHTVPDGLTRMPIRTQINPHRILQCKHVAYDVEGQEVYGRVERKIGDRECVRYCKKRQI
jgi:hypothetical protein